LITIIQLREGANELLWNLHGSDKLSVDSMYRSLVQPDVSIDNIFLEHENSA
jgi:hypothetical protein